jgi:signal peptidase I
MSTFRCKFHARKRAGRMTGGDLHLPSELINDERFPLADGDKPIMTIDEEGNLLIKPEEKGAWIWTIAEGGWNWIRDALKDKQVTSYGYNQRRKPRNGDTIVFYSNKKLYGTVPVCDDARETTHEDTEKDDDLKHWKYVMYLDCRGLKIFGDPIPIKDVADNIEILKGKNNLHAVCRNNPRISLEEYEYIIEKSRQEKEN